jgi:short-subunit dehydrogenase
MACETPLDEFFLAATQTGNGMTYQGMTAFITGASAGLGEAFARQLAQQGADLVLVARSEEKLERLAETLRALNKVQIVVLPADLSSADAVQHLIGEVKRRDLRIDILVNNAGYGVFENFVDASLARQIGQIDVNIRAVVSLAYAFIPDMILARRGGVINVASTAAFQPLAGANVYAASKAFVLFFSEGLALELEKTGVTVTAACPGPVATRFFEGMKPNLRANQMDRPVPVVDDILRGFARGKKIVYPGKLRVYLSTLGARFLPRNMILRLAVGVTKKFNQA